jgi:hypothetical protein
VLLQESQQNWKRNIAEKRVGAVILAIFFAVILCTAQTPFLMPLVNSYRLPGRHFVLRRPVMVYLTRSAIKEEDRMRSIGDSLGLVELSRSGQRVGLPACIRVLCVEAHYSAVRVRVLSGRREGQLWWLPMQLVQHPVIGLPWKSQLSLVETELPGYPTPCGTAACPKCGFHGEL